MKRVTVIGLALLAILLATCANEDTKEPPRFEDEDLRFKLIQSDNDLGNLSYIIEVQNTGKLKIGYLKLYISYSTKHGSNPFKVEGKTETNNPVMLGEGEKATFRVYAPVKDVFGNNTLLDFDRPNLNFEGYVLEGDQVIPFGLGGSFDAILRDY